MRRIACLLALLLPLVTGGPAWAQSLERMAGQMVLVGFQGDTPQAEGFQAVRDQIARGQIGGVMFLRTNISDLANVREMNQELAGANQWLPPFIALDQEGGQIRRLTEEVGFAEIPSAEALGQGDVETAEAVYRDLADRLAQEGFTVNFGPVVDLNLNPDNPIIARYERAFGDDPEAVAAFAAAFVNGHRSANVVTALKHFPGHGSSTGDTHEGFVDVTGDWESVELEPYKALIRTELVDMIMVAHIFNAEYAGAEQLDLPASLSPEWIEGVLRGELGYDGVVISDDMEMSAVTDHFDMRETVVRAVMAGNDIVLFANTVDMDPDLGAKIHAVIVEQARADPAFAARVEESYQRIMALKQRMAEGL